jgi:hypothetical protein
MPDASDRGRSARRRGIAFEQELARYLGTVTTRSTRPGIHDDAGDVVWPDWTIEAKNVTRWQVQAWFTEVERKAGLYDNRPALIVKRPRRNMGDALLIVRLKDVIM